MLVVGKGQTFVLGIQGENVDGGEVDTGSDQGQEERLGKQLL